MDVEQRITRSTISICELMRKIKPKKPKTKQKTKVKTLIG